MVKHFWYVFTTDTYSFVLPWYREDPESRGPLRFQVVSLNPAHSCCSACVWHASVSSLLAAHASSLILLANMPTAILDAVLLNVNRVQALRAVARSSRCLPALTYLTRLAPHVFVCPGRKQDGDH